MCRNALQCVHEPFGDAWYFGPERLSDRFEKDENAREESGFSQMTYRNVFEGIEQKHEKVLFFRSLLTCLIFVPYAFYPFSL